MKIGFLHFLHHFVLFENFIQIKQFYLDIHLMEIIPCCKQVSSYRSFSDSTGSRSFQYPVPHENHTRIKYDTWHQMEHEAIIETKKYNWCQLMLYNSILKILNSVFRQLQSNSDLCTLNCMCLGKSVVSLPGRIANTSNSVSSK